MFCPLGMLLSSHRLPKNQDIRCPFYHDTDLNSRKKGDIYRFSWPICLFCLHSFSFDRFIRSAIPKNRASLMSCIVVYGTRTKVQPKSRPSVNSGLMLTLDCTICQREQCTLCIMDQTQ